MDDRLTRIEEKLAFMDDLVDKLNRALVDQQRQIDGLERRLSAAELATELAARDDHLDDAD